MVRNKKIIAVGGGGFTHNKDNNLDLVVAGGLIMHHLEIIMEMVH